MRLIDADALHKALSAKQKWVVHCGDKHNEGYTSDQVHFAIDDAPTVDQVKHGHWVDTTDEPYGEAYRPFICSLCRGSSTSMSEYCPHCGAKMDEVEK